MATTIVSPKQLAPLGPSGSGHQAGIAPDPGSSAGTTRFLREDATWVAPPGTGITQSQADARYPGPATSVFVATSATQAAIQAANVAAQTAGGGTVVCPDAGSTGIVVTTVGFTLYDGVSWVGVPPRFTYPSPSGLADSGIAFTGGTWFTSHSGVSYNPNTPAGFAPMFGTGTGTVAAASFPCFWDGATNTGTQPTSTAAFSATATTGVRMSDIGIAGFSIGVSMGAQNVAGSFYCDFTNLYIEGCSHWGFNCTNPAHVKGYGIHCFGNGQGDGLTGNFICQGWVNQGIYQTGNCLFNDVYGFTPTTATVPTSVWNRNIVFQALCPDLTTLASLNEIYATRIQGNAFGRSATSQTATTVASQTFSNPGTGLSAALAISGSYLSFPVGFPVVFTTSNLLPAGLSANTIYWIVSSSTGQVEVSATQGGAAIFPTSTGTGVQTIAAAGVSVSNSSSWVVGAPVAFTAAAPTGFAEYQIYTILQIPASASNVLVLGNSINSTAPVSPTSATTSTLASTGFPNIEIVGNNNGSTQNSTIANTNILGIDTEGNTECGIYLLNCGGVNITIGQIPGVANKPDICARNSNFSTVICPGVAITDYDSSSTNITHIGPRGLMIQRSGIWTGLDTTLGTYALNLFGANRANSASLILAEPSGDTFIAPVANMLGVGVFHSSSTTVSFTGRATEALATGSSNSTWTLPTIVNTSTVNSHLGLIKCLTNTGTAVVTVDTSGSQGIGIGGSTLASLSIYPGQKYRFIAQYDGTNLFWAAECLTFFGVMAQADLTSQAATVSSVATYTPVATGTFQISAYVTVTTTTSGVLTTTVTYHDEGGAARTQTFYNQGSTSAGTSGTGQSSYPPMTIRAGTGGAITVVCTLTTSTATFDVGAQIRQVA